MPRGEMLARMDSRELSAWYVLFDVKGEEAEHARHVAESNDGIVEIHGLAPDEDDTDDDDGRD